MKMKFCLVKEKMLKIFIKKFKKLCLGDDIIKKRIEWIDVFKGFNRLRYFQTCHVASL